jgi:hypothetical protein
LAKSRICFATIFLFVEEDEIIHEKEEHDDEGWISDIVFFCGCDRPLEYS